MLEKPDISDNFLISQLEEEYGLQIAELTFLPLGADLGTAVYRVATDDRMGYFLKLREGFEEVTVTVPLFLKSQGVPEIITPIETKSNRHWADFGEYKIILYPFINGKDGFDKELTDTHRKALGATLKRIHTTSIPPDLKRLIPKETFDPQRRQSLKSFQAQINNDSYKDPTAAKLAGFMKSKRGEISHLIARADQLASELQLEPLELVLCHSDIHGGNVLISDEDELYIVDWDNPILSPKERDLMFVGGGIDHIWKSEREEAVFYEGYGKTSIDFAALAFYRYERVIEDLAVICEQVLSSDDSGADRERSIGWFLSNFESGSTIQIAEETHKLLMETKK